MKTCTNKDCIHEGKPQPEENFYWKIKDVRRRTRCMDCLKAEDKERRKRKLAQQECDAALFNNFDRFLKAHD